MARKRKQKKIKKSTIKSLTSEEKEQIVELRKQKKTPTEISNIVSVQRCLVKKILTQKDKKPKAKRSRNNPFAFKGIYMIKNDINGKIYIGQSADIFRRWQEHTLKSQNKELYQDILNYGLAAFSWKILVQHKDLTRVQLFRLENTFIKYYQSIKTGYNKIYTSYNFYDIDLKDKTSEDILDFVFNN